MPSRALPISPKSVNRPQHERLYRMIKMLADGKYPNCSDFAREFEVERRTVLRDMDYLRDRMRVPVEFDRQRNGYYLTEPIENFPLIEIQESDLVLLFVAQRVAAQCGDAVLESRLKQSFARLASVLGDTILTTWSELDSLLSFRTAGLGVAEVKSFELLQQCLRNSTGVSFLYKGHKDTKAQKRKVHPYHLGFINQQWYLFAWDTDRHDMRTFSLARIQKVKDTGKPFVRDPKVSIKEIISQGFGVVSTPGESLQVLLRFTPNLAQVMGERKWHPSQVNTSLPDGSVEIRMEVSNSNELHNWIMSWGANVEVIAPAILRETIARIARQTASLYTESDPA